MGSMLGPNRVIAKDVKSVPTATIADAQQNSTSSGECLGPKQGQFICLICNMAKMNDLWDGSLVKRKVHGLVPCCGQNVYRAQVP